MTSNNCMLWTLTAIEQGKGGASTATSHVAVLENGAFKAIPTPVRDTVIAAGEQLVIYTIAAENWQFVAWHGDQKAPDGKPSSYPDTPLLMAENDQVKIISWSPSTLVLLDRNTKRDVLPFYASLTNSDLRDSENDYWDPQIVNDGSGTD